MYEELEGNWNPGASRGSTPPSPNTAALLADAQTMLARSDETMAAVLLSDSGLQEEPALRYAREQVESHDSVQGHHRALDAGRG